MARCLLVAGQGWREWWLRAAGSSPDSWLVPALLKGVVLPAPRPLPPPSPPQSRLTVSSDSSAGELRGVHDRDFTTDGRLPLCPFDHDFREDEDGRCGECRFDPVPSACLGASSLGKTRVSLF